MDEKKDQGLEKTTIGLMIATAAFFDAVQAVLELIPILGWLLSSALSAVAFLTFYIWFKLHGLSFATPKRAGFLGGGFIIELVPILNALPAWTLAVVMITLDAKMKKVVSAVPGGEQISKELGSRRG